jgi:hypothetical protein
MLRSAAAERNDHVATGTFGTAITCIDGRVQAPVSDWVKLNCNVTYVDTVTVPAPDHLFAEGVSERIGHTGEYVQISVNAHHSGVVAVAGHHDCAAYPASDEEHKAAIRAAARHIAGWGLPVRVVGLWVNSWWQVEVVCDSAAATL